MNKVLLIGPIGDFGGRELEVGFISNIFKAKYNVDICTTGYVTKQSQVYNFDKSQQVFSLNELLCRKYKEVNLLAFLSSLKNYKAEQICYYANNAISKKYFGYDKKRLFILKKLIEKYNLVFICAQLSSNLIPEIIKISSSLGKPIIFRTTGTINKNMLAESNIFKKVNLFIHHSRSNAQRFEDHYFKHKYAIVDQCAFNELHLLKIPYVNKNVSNFITISRLVEEKNINIVIKAFKSAKTEGDKLFIVGDGPELKNLKEMAEDDEDIIFTGFISNSDLVLFLKKVDCVIISYYKLETGPLTGIEAMASARLIISSTTGAMSERLPFNKYWFNNTSEELVIQIKKIKKLPKEKVLNLSKKVRRTYLKNYKISLIQKKYIEIIDSCFEG